MPFVGVSVPVLPPDRAAFYRGIDGMTLVELIDWPVAVVIIREPRPTGAVQRYDQWRSIPLFLFFQAVKP